MNEGADVFAAQHLFQVAHYIHVEHIDGESVFATHGCGGDVHHFQAAREHFIVGDVVELRSRGVLFGVGGVNAIHARSLEHNVGFDFDAAQ